MQENQEKNNYQQGEIQPVVTFDVVQFEARDPDSIKYLLLLNILDIDIDNTELNLGREWMIIEGRQEAYDYIKNLVIAEAIDIHKSYIISDTATLDKGISAYAFMKHCEEKKNVITSFDVDEYNHDEDYENNYMPILEYTEESTNLYILKNFLL